MITVVLPTRPDDVYFFEIVAGGAMGTYTYEYNTPDGPVTGTGRFNRTERLGPVPIGFNVSGTVVPTDLTCEDVGAFFVQSPDACGDCELFVAELSNECNDNGTADETDDFFTVTALVRASSGGFAYMVDLPDGTTRIGMYATADSIFTASFPVAGGDVTLTFRDVDSSLDCETTITFQAPSEPCSSGPCSINVTLTEQTPCDDGGTPSDPTDDTFRTTFVVEGENTSSAGWVVPGVGITGQYGEPITLTWLTGTDISLDIQDADDASCSTNLSIDAPESCSVPPCDIVVTFDSEVKCGQDGGYTVDVTITNEGGGRGWVLPNGITGLYGDTYTIGVEDVCSEFTVIVRDQLDADCFETVSVTPPPITLTVPDDTDMVNGVDLVCTDVTEIFNNPNSLALTGEAVAEGCGLDSLTFTRPTVECGRV